MHAMKKVSIAIMVAVFVATICLPLAILPSKVYADTTYAIGDTGPAGGIVFYDKGDDVGGWRYLEAAPSDQSTSAWSNITSTWVNCNITAIGTGQANTTKIINQIGHTASAAKICDDLTLGGYSDWFLPSLDELIQMYSNRVAIGGFAGESYWSSSEWNEAYASKINFSNGDWDASSKGNVYLVRAIRAFSASTASTASTALTASTAAEESAPVWVRTMPMTCWQVWINEDNMFEFIFWWEYGSNNWVKIYDMEDNLVYELDFPYGAPRFAVDLPGGMYTVKTFHDGFETPIQEFIIGKP